VKVRVDSDLGTVRVMQVVSVFDVGRVMNPKTAKSQAYSGITQGIGMALMEQTIYDKRNGAIVTDSLADYLLPVNADVPTSMSPSWILPISTSARWGQESRRNHHHRSCTRHR